MPCQNPSRSARLVLPEQSCRAVVFVDQATDHVPPPDPRRHVDHLIDPMVRWQMAAALVRPMAGSRLR
jgi:hypothetical protein